MGSSHPQKKIDSDFYCTPYEDLQYISGRIRSIEEYELSRIIYINSSVTEYWLIRNLDKRFKKGDYVDILYKLPLPAISTYAIICKIELCTEKDKNL
jgi:hypothetical protein